MHTIRYLAEEGIILQQEGGNLDATLSKPIQRLSAEILVW